MSTRKPSTSTLDLFLLALIGEGIDTAYAMREVAGISVGATLPALRRLEAAGLVERKPGPRSRSDFTLLPAGKRALKIRLDGVIQAIELRLPAETESILRIAAIALANGEQSALKRILSAAASDRKRRARLLKRVAERSSEAGVGHVYREMLDQCAAARYSAEAKLLAKLSKLKAK